MACPYGGVVKQVASGSIGEEIGIEPGDILRSINGHCLRDVIDYQFYGDEEELDLVIERSGKQHVLNIERDLDEPLGLDFEVEENPIVRNILDLNDDQIAEIILEFSTENLKKYIVINFDPILKEIKFHKAPNQDARAIYLDGEVDGSVYTFKIDEENGMYIQRKMDKDEGAFKDFFLRLVPFSSMLYYDNLE